MREMKQTDTTDGKGTDSIRKSQRQDPLIADQRNNSPKAHSAESQKS